MKPIRSALAVAVLCAASGITGIVGYNMVENVQFARAAQTVEATRQQLHQAEDLSTVFREISKVVSPSVVKIDITKKVEGYRSWSPFENDPMFRHFFPNMPDQGQGDDNGTLEQQGTGSGVIMDTDGDKVYIVTNNHVAGGAEEMTVTLADGRKFEHAKLIGADPRTDLAVVEIEAQHVIPAKWGDSDQMSQGDWVLAFGAPFGYVGSMTHGIISALHRTDIGIISNGYENFIQVDAPINPGNSGGPLVNLHGEVIGINTAIASQSGGFQGIGFAIPSDMVRNIYNEIRTKGKVVYGYLGVKIESVSNDSEVAQSLGYTKNDGVVIEQVGVGTPATGVLKAGDIVTSANDKTVNNADELREEIAKITPGDKVKLHIFRNNDYRDVTVKIGEQPQNLSMANFLGHRDNQSDNSDNSATANLSDLGIRLGDLTDDRAQQLGLHNVQGAVVLNVEPGSPAFHAGLAAGDVINSVGSTDITSADEAESALSKANLSKGVRLYVTHRDGSQQFVFVKPSKNHD
ncbi:MAG TPA: trypsin-like peptidase domain-containing protein [Tepidisphaeraceae bacterium]|jgi:serine protease Do